MSGLPPNRPLNANDTDIGNYTAPPEGPFENVDYYQSVMTDYFETMGIPIVKGRAFQPSDAASGPVVIVNETLVNTFWKDRDPIGQTLKPGLAHVRASAGLPRHRRREGRQAGRRRQEDRHRALSRWSIRPRWLPPPITNAPGTMNIVLRTTLPPASAADRRSKAIVREADPSVPIVRLRDMNGVFEESITPAAPARAAARRLRRPRAAARRDRHLRRAVVHGRRTPPRDRHPHGARRRSGQRARRR